ncbi:alkaline phosphatase 4-like [Bombus vosnesenskii]|uniref:Alkaline phosphatase n=4 Tax=Pyrobombus TaxID=144703 RepID=A0A6J3KX62_9HYME|nr:alkaline phosphatase 4-like isoform X1 [Bombus vancouverensis nearcticus]XP_033305439.1 alkaline phosphatase 4-like [Bombus bifarius]XP_033357973.1 alkaline phosphatase 4-like [Bombus vosnesenskii]XP_050480882.1 alkaline phosphatase 4-like isoform X2 [Bombus huntii]
MIHLRIELFGFTNSTKMRCLAVLACSLLGFLELANSLPRNATHYEDMSFWLKSGQENLQRILAYRNNENRAKNVIIFIGDGMGVSTITAGRIYKGQIKGNTGEEYKLAFENFPNTGFAKTYNTDKQVPDSAGTATAIFSGVKCRYKVIGLDTKASFNRCNNKTDKESKVTTVADWAQESGMDTGFVTTTRITHATPGGLYAHTNNRDWECDTSIPAQYKGCVKDIARQLIEDEPGNKFKVIMGGGAQHMGLPMEPIDPDTCVRGDGQNLADVWAENNPDGKVVTNLEQLLSVDIANTSKILGIFAPSHLPYHAVKTEQTPSLAEMTQQAVRLLKKNDKGFLLMVESGRIDMAHHHNWAKLALRELSELEEAISVALQEVKLEETLVIVTADHSHAFTMNGYPKRGNDILGFANDPNNPKIQSYETLSYINGPGFYHHRRNDSNNVNETWRPVDQDKERDEPYYPHMAGIYLEDETHGGEDVGVYAIGPYSHLIRGTFEQNYIAHVVAYAACLKNWPSHCDNSHNSVTQPTSSPIVFLLTSVLLLIVTGFD